MVDFFVRIAVVLLVVVVVFFVRIAVVLLVVELRSCKGKKKKFGCKCKLSLRDSIYIYNKKKKNILPLQLLNSTTNKTTAILTKKTTTTTNKTTAILTKKSTKRKKRN